MKRHYYILLITFSICLFVLPFIFNDSINHLLSISCNLVGSFCSIITLFIAIILFDKYGLKKSLIEKKADLVLRLIENLKQVRLFMKNDKQFVQYRPLTDWQSTYEMFNDMLLVFNKDYLSGLNKIFEYADNLYLPISIVEKIRNLEPSSITYDLDRLANPDYFEVSVPGLQKSEDIFGRLNGKNMTFYDFNNLWIEILEEAEKWLKENDIEIKELNVI
jgi:hypothetical protein